MHHSAAVSVALALVALPLILGLTAPSVAASPTYPTTTVSQAGMTETTLNGLSGVLVNCNSTAASSFSGILYLDLTNAQGQTVYWNRDSCNFAQGVAVLCFVSISSTVPAGTYTATTFVATTTDVPISTSSTFSLTV